MNARALIVTLVVPAIATAAAGSVPAPPAPPGGPLLISWTTEAVRCGDGTQPAFVRTPDPVPAAAYGFTERVPMLTATFRIDADGRPMGVAPQTSDYVPDSSDVLPALVASRFAGGQPHERCTVRFVAVRQPIATAAPELAQRFTVFPGSVRPRQAWERSFSAGSNCFEPAPAPLIRAFPDFRRMSGEPGRREWSMVGFDLDQDGRPRGAHVVSGSDWAPLDAAATKAVADSRFERGARTGCLYPYYRNAAVLHAPSPPSEDALRPAGSTCPHDLPFARPPALIFPESYRQRSIEGWAMVAYDVAPWGEIGNLRILAAEPAAEFGEQAKRLLGGARKPAGSTGYVGCIDRVAFRMGEPGRPAAALAQVDAVVTND